MKPRVVVLLLLIGAGRAPLCAESFRPRGIYNNAVHRFFPDLDQRENAIRYGRWRALELCWTGGVSAELDAAFSERLRMKMRALPDFPPDPRLSAPQLAQQAPRTFEALLAADTLEREIADILAASDATPVRNQDRIERALNHYQDLHAALSTPSEAFDVPPLEKFSTGRLLLTGDWLFAAADEDLTVSGYGDQRWHVKATVERYDVTLAAPPTLTAAAAGYSHFAPNFSAAFRAVSMALDRATRFRIEIFAALSERDSAARRESVSRVERRYRLVP